MRVTLLFNIPYVKENYEVEPGIYMTEEEAAAFEKRDLEEGDITIMDLLDLSEGEIEYNVIKETNT